jgi:hypothetical protein
MTPAKMPPTNPQDLSGAFSKPISFHFGQKGIGYRKARMLSYNGIDAAIRTYCGSLGIGNPFFYFDRVEYCQAIKATA